MTTYSLFPSGNIFAGMTGIVDYTNHDDMKYAVSYFACVMRLGFSFGTVFMRTVAYLPNDFVCFGSID